MIVLFLAGWVAVMVVASMLMPWHAKLGGKTK
jgi:hypothetical protein